jgi:hypothetical protein
MPRYFSEQTLLDMRDKDMNHVYDLTDLEEYLAGVPTANVVEVVRCKDCYFWSKQKDSCQGRCELSGNYPTGNWYCANGRKGR